MGFSEGFSCDDCGISEARLAFSDTLSSPCSHFIVHEELSRHEGQLLLYRQPWLRRRPRRPLGTGEGRPLPSVISWAR